MEGIAGKEISEVISDMIDYAKVGHIWVECNLNGVIIMVNEHSDYSNIYLQYLEDSPRKGKRINLKGT